MALLMRWKKEWKHNRDKLEEEEMRLKPKERYLKLKDELVNLATMENLEKAQKLMTMVDMN